MRALAAVVLTILVALPACASTHDGRLMVVVSSDIPAPATLARVRIEVAGEVRELDLVDGTQRLPFSLVVEASPGRLAGQPVDIAVSALDGGGAVLLTRPVRTTFVPNRTLIVPVDLARRCTADAPGCSGQLRCSPSEACTQDGCVSPALDASELRDVRTPGDELRTAGEGFTPEQACAELGLLVCGAVLRCCPILIGYTQERLDELRTRCLASYEASCMENLVPVLADPRTGFDPVRAATVIAEGNALAADCNLGYADWTTSFERGLYSAMHGTIETGGTCTYEEGAGLFSCRDGACLPAPITFAPVCADRACEGEPCVGDYDLADYGCGDELFCAPSGSGFACARRLVEGATCTRDTQCASRLCLGAVEGGAPGACAARTIDNVYCPRG